MLSSALRFRSLLLSSMLVMALILGCKGTDPAPATTTDLSGNYKVTALTETKGNQTLDYLQLMAAFGLTCAQDLVISFKADGSFSSNNPASCAGADAVDEFKGGKWAASGTTLSLTATNQPKEDWTYAVTGNKLVLTQTAAVNGVSSTAKMELTKQ
ncbi:lipocalin family protein [Fibrella forsythiae]|uniref:Lipocalin-like domain-containing protein n=1 Tax=Fibrella forsythiae TaxID=2817061 RepID=A0ABS3JVW8_9BACT|nr:DUF5004 domain-containing protein [Fibrella forsythiae]MBO0953324.1 hypothetical protein [Fibrella forsythiae]